MAIQQVNKFQELISSSDLPLLVVFEATWCGPCHMMDIIIEQLNNQLGQQLKIVKLNSENDTDLANQYHIHPLPTLLVFKNGEVVERIEAERMENFMSVEKLVQRLQKHI